ncbi:MAG: hypothetical protein JJU33_08845 [Phycisphaerales bacterium]|nr:hypothetical protein [Phycisphaerales bacterium]
MKNFNVVSCAAVAALAGIGAPVGADTITLSDNGVHYFDSTISLVNLRNATTLHVHEPANVTLRLDAANQSKTHFHGGFIKRIDTWHQAALEMLGGHTDQLYANNSSTVEIRGGTLDWLYVNGGSRVDVYGMADLELQPFVRQFDYLRYRLVGTLLDGSSVSTWIWVDDSQGATAEINLVIHAIPLPGPAGMAMAGLGICCAVRRRRA